MEHIVNFAEPREKNLILSQIRSITSGQYRINIKRYRSRRSDAQNRFWWGVVVPIFADFLREQGWQYTDEQAHEELKAKFLVRDIVNEVTGEVKQVVGSTADLDRVEFIHLIDNVGQWLAEFANIVLPEPRIYRERE